MMVWIQFLEYLIQLAETRRDRSKHPDSRADASFDAKCLGKKKAWLNSLIFSSANGIHFVHPDPCRGRGYSLTYDLSTSKLLGSWKEGLGTRLSHEL